MITILADAAVSGMGQGMYEKIAKTRDDVRYFCMEGMKIEPCYSCRGCEEKTYGRCIVRDDADLILPCLARSKTIIVFTPIVYGAYSFQIKRAFDKIALIGDRHYYYRHGEVVKGKPSLGIKYYAVGLHDGKDMEEVQVFRQFVMETITIAGWTGRAVVMPHDAADYSNLIQEAAQL